MCHNDVLLWLRVKGHFAHILIPMGAYSGYGDNQSICKE